MLETIRFLFFVTRVNSSFTSWLDVLLWRLSHSFRWSSKFFSPPFNFVSRCLVKLPKASMPLNGLTCFNFF